MEGAWAASKAQYRLDYVVAYKKLVAEVSASREALLDDVGQLVRAEIRGRPLVGEDVGDIRGHHGHRGGGA